MCSTVVLSIALVALAALANGDDPQCVSEDNNVDGTLFKTLRQELQQHSSEFITFNDFQQGIMGFGVRWSGAQAGNFSSLQLTPSPDATPSSRLCTEVTNDTSVKTLSINLSFNNLQTEFKTFIIETPFLNIGGEKTSISLNGENLNVIVVTTTDTKAKTCSVDLKEFKFTNWGNLQVSLGGGILNFFLEKIFNNYANSMVLNLLEEFGVATIINTDVTTYATQLISASGQQQTVCELINLL